MARKRKDQAPPPAGAAAADAEARALHAGGRALAAGAAAAVVLALAAAAALRIAGVARTREPVVYRYRVVRQYDHDPLAFTQGLLWANGSLYESTGLYGRSSVRELELGEGRKVKVLREVRLDKEHFGEGLVEWRGEMLQLLWRRPEVLRFSARAGDGGHLERRPAGPRTPLSDGWGFATDGKSLLVTDGGPDVFHLDPESLSLQRSVRVTDGGRAVEMINELEFIDRELWGNVYGQECLVRIDASSGAVLGWVDLSGLLDRGAAVAEATRAGRDPPDVLNGIAWDAERRRLFVTGKLWPSLFEIEVEPHPTLSLEEARRRCIPERNLFRKSAR